MNQTIQNILDRHSTRAYTNDPVPEDALAAILRAGAAAGHGIGHRTRRFTVITAPDKLAIVNSAIRDAFRALEPNEQMPPFIRGLIKKAKADDKVDFIYRAPAFIIVSVNADSVSGAIDTALAIGNMSIAAQSLDLGSCWMNQMTTLVQTPPIVKALRELGIPDDETVYGTLAVGTPAPNARFAPREAGEFVYLT
ncbi:MAG: nitroreductase family protein [Coriobacteriales bacterium]|jgi:nitroreductase|nr:nitroreductase family protein [Coriobacteriales bacterium]